MGPIEISFYPAGVSEPSWPCFSYGRKFGKKSRNEKMKKLWSDLVVQRNGWAYPAQNFELYHMGMVSGVLVLMGVAKVGFFMFFWQFFLTPWKTAGSGWNGRPKFGTPWKQGPLKPCPFERSRDKLSGGGIKTSVRPNPTIVFSFWSFDFLC